ncbi:MAG: nucleotide exchange factor GrpE [Candidatus Bathyarchaeia archaeon]|nr:nucleotide exchange factor GrpE [Candidatus Bathyarchaeota archaeon]
MGEKKEQEKGSKQTEALKKALEAEKKRSEEYLVQLKYARADVENLRKSFDQKLEEARKYSNERIIIELLDVVDELEMAVQSARSSNSTEALIQGVEMTLKKLKKTLQNEGVSPIKSVGEPFDPLKHNAVERTEKEGVEGCIVIEEIRKGYTLKEKVIRPSMVKVVMQPSQSHEEAKSNE